MVLLHKINKLATSLAQLTTITENTTINYLHGSYNSDPKDIVDKIINFAEKLKLVQIDNNKIGFTDTGKKLFEKITNESGMIFWDPNNEQINFLKKEFLEQKHLTVEFNELIEKFWVDSKQRNTPTLTYILEQNQNYDPLVLEYLKEINIFEIIDRRINHHIETQIYCRNNLLEISKVRNKTKHVSEEDLLRRLEENRLVGKKGEEYAIKDEKRRLKEEEGRVDLALDIKQISVTNAYAGYDLESYDDKKSNLTKHDRMIEVKSTTGSSPRFYWSSNEVEKAEKLGKRYWIYLWINVMSDDKRKLKRIQDPYTKFFKDNTLATPKCTGYLLEKNLIEIIPDE